MSSPSSKRRIFFVIIGILMVFFVLLLAFLLDHFLENPASVADTTVDATSTTLMSGAISIHSERDADIGRMVGTLLEKIHYSQQPITPEMSQRWLKNYLQDLDYNHVFFLQSDVDEFNTKYSSTLGDLLMHNDSDDAAVAPAFEIFGRYYQRLQEKVSLVEKLVNQKQDFTLNETYNLPSDKSPWPADQAASNELWRKQIKSEILDGLLEQTAGNNKPALSAEEAMAKITKRILKRYHQVLQDNKRKDETDIIEAYYNAFTHAYDPHSDYFSPDEAQNFTIQSIDLSVTGIGAVLKSDDGYATIEQVVAGGPADLDKRLQVGDRIVAVGQDKEEPVDAKDLSLNKVVEMIRGKKDTLVRLIVWPVGATDPSIRREIIIKRDKVILKDSLAKAHIIQHNLPDGTRQSIGVIDLREFYNNTAQDVAKLILRLKQERVTGIILDMRNNGGGLLDQAVDLTGLFVRKHEPVVQIRRSDNFVEVLKTDNTSPIYDGPLVVMVNKASASATEIVAGALQDYDRAIIVGDQSTHGKGTVQTLLPLQQWAPIGFKGDPGKLKLTVQKFYRVAGGSTQQKGVLSDIVLPDLLDAVHLGETTLPYYLPYDTIKPATFDYLNLRSPYLNSLQKLSESRVTTSPDFSYLRQDIERLKKKVDDKSISLNLDVRSKERDDLKQEQAKRKADLASRQKTRDVELDLTLDMVQNNLPPAPPEKKAKPKSLEDDSDFPNPDENGDNPSFDPALNETVNIMSDYANNLKDNGVTSNQH